MDLENRTIPKLMRDSTEIEVDKPDSKDNSVECLFAFSLHDAISGTTRVAFVRLGGISSIRAVLGSNRGNALSGQPDNLDSSAHVPPLRASGHETARRIQNTENSGLAFA